MNLDLLSSNLVWTREHCIVHSIVFINFANELHSQFHSYTLLSYHIYLDANVNCICSTSLVVVHVHSNDYQTIIFRCKARILSIKIINYLKTNKNCNFNSNSPNNQCEVFECMRRHLLIVVASKLRFVQHNNKFAYHKS